MVTFLETKECGDNFLAGVIGERHTLKVDICTNNWLLASRISLKIIELEWFLVVEESIVDWLNQFLSHHTSSYDVSRFSPELGFRVNLSLWFDQCQHRRVILQK